MFRFLIVLISSLSCATGGAEPRSVPLDEIEPTATQRRATTLITQLFSRDHYKKTPLDDNFSSELLDRYLESLDPGRRYFTLEDVNSFASNRYRLDDMLRRAQVEVAFDIFKRFRSRVDARIETALGQLNSELTFDDPEEYRFDRSDLQWASTLEDLDEVWRKRVKNDVLTQRLVGKDRAATIDILSKRYERITRRVSQLNANDVYQLYMSSYGRTIEPHTTYLSPRSSENFRIRMSLSLEGIGAALQTENEYTVVRRIITGGPAELDKRLKIDDRIVGVAQGDAEMVDVVAWRLEDVVDLIRGSKGTQVRLDILPKGAGPGGKHHVVDLMRDKVKLEEQAAKRSIITLPGKKGAKVGVIDLPTFYLDIDARARGDSDFRSTTRDVRRLLGELDAEGIHGVIIDLRGNSGGSLVEATDLTGLFIDTGPVVQMRYTDGRIQVNKDTDAGVAYDGPVVVLVDRFSASASEIFAGALQDYRRGLILGEPTFGKGTVQILVPLDRYAEAGTTGLGHLKMTVAQFFRVNGHSTQHRGVTPDIIFPTALGAESVGERALENALEWSKTEPAYYSPHGARPGLVENLRVRHEDRTNADPRFTYLIAEAKAIKSSGERTSVTLSEKDRRAERDKLEAESLARENQLRVAKGHPARDPGAELDSTKGFGDILGDAVLDEAAQILIDAVSAVDSRTTPALESASN
jgi:carboxyl-terminal processing protease